MKLKITYEYDTRLELNRVIGFSCVSPANALYKYLSDNQIYVDGSGVPMSFYRDWHNYVVSSDKSKIEWNGTLYLEHSSR